MPSYKLCLPSPVQDFSSMVPRISSNWKALSAVIKGENISVSTESSKGNNVKKREGSKDDDLWFEVDEQTLRRSKIESKLAEDTNTTVSIIELFPSLPLTSSQGHLKDAGKYVAMDCEMVGVGPDGVRSALARVSIVNYHGEVLLDRHVKPIEAITDYRTHVSGIEPHHLVGAPALSEIQEEVWKMIQGKVLIGHSLKNDFQALLLEHPRKMTRDTSKYRPFRRIAMGKSPSLKKLAKHFLGIEIQGGSHDSVDDARVTMLLYRNHKVDWENYLFRQEGKVFKQQKRLKLKGRLAGKA